jgi:molybdopterin-guanine dinucleotide biosynthesis protein A
VQYKEYTEIKGLFRQMPRKSTVRKAKTTGRSKTPGPVRPQNSDTLEALVAAYAEALALPLDAGWQAGTRRNIELLLRHAALIDEFPLPDDCDPASVFRA